MEKVELRMLMEQIELGHESEPSVWPSSSA
jgi:hypothetical protein